MNRRVLFSTIGATPQVVTETVWALRNSRNPPWIADEIHVVTTTFALGRIREALQSPNGQLASLFGGKAPPVTIHVPTRNAAPLMFSPLRDGEYLAPAPDNPDALRDVSTQHDAGVMGTLILRVLAALAHDNTTELHVSLAGGRKTMSAHALLAMALVARPRDEASHVLVAPEAFEDNPTFWHPDQAGPVQVRLRGARCGQDSETDVRNASEAHVILVPTPIPLLRHEVEDAEVLASLDLVEGLNLINLAARLQGSPRIMLLTASNEIVAVDVRRSLYPKDFALYRLLATACHESWPGVGPKGEGQGHAGWLSVPHVYEGRTPKGQAIGDMYLTFLKQALTVKKDEWGDIDHVTGKVLKPDKSVRSWLEVHQKPELAQRLKQAQKAIGSFTRLKAALVAAFGRPAAALMGPVVITRKQLRLTQVQGTRVRVTPTGWTRFGLTLPPASINIV